MKLLGALVCLFLTFQIGQVSNADAPMLPISQTDMARLFGLQVSLVDEHNVMDLWFYKDGTVDAQVGVKNGPVCAPIFTWSLSKDGVLTSADDKGNVQFKWSAIGFVPDGICVQSARKVERYIIVKRQAKSN